MTDVSERAFWGLLLVLIGGVILTGVVAASRAPADIAPRAYLAEETEPAGVVYNAYVAARRQDMERFLAYFKDTPWEANGTLSGITTYELDRGELRVGEVEINGNRASVQVLLIEQAPGFLFGPEVRVREGTVRLEKSNGRWYIVSPLPFVYPVWKLPPPPSRED